MALKFMEEQDRKNGTRKPQMTMMVIADSGRGKHAILKEAKQDIMCTMWQSMSLKEQMMYLLGSLKNDMPMGEIMPGFDQEADMSWKKSQEPVVGLKYGKGYKLRCCPESLMAA